MPIANSYRVFLCFLFGHAACGRHDDESTASTSATSAATTWGSAGDDNGGTGSVGDIPVGQCIAACHEWSDALFASCLGGGSIQAQCQADKIARDALCESIEPDECDEDLLEQFDTGGDPSAGDSSDDDAGADDCSFEDDRCEDDVLWSCDGVDLLPQSCEDFCAEIGEGASLGCSVGAYGEPSCACAPAEVCSDGESRCTGPDSGQDCIDGQWSEDLSCDAFCQDLGYDLSTSCVQVGQEAQCQCAWACNPAVDTTACADGDPSLLLWCHDSGVWMSMSCAEHCADYGAVGTTGCGWHPNEQVWECWCIW